MAAQKVHCELGYDEKKMVLIENGFDTEKHQRLPERRDAFRSELGVENGTFLVGHAGRFDPQKDHQTLVHAAKLVLNQRPDIRFVFCGTNVTPENEALRGMIEAVGIQDHVYLKGIQYDMPAFYCAMDIQVMCSAYGEGGSNVLGEAMACETPCISTDVGDSAHIIGDTGDIVPSGDAPSLAERILARAHEDIEMRAVRGKRARQAIVDKLSLLKMVEAYQALYQTTVTE